MKSLNQIAEATLKRLLKPGKTVDKTEKIIKTTITTVTVSKSPFGDLSIGMFDWVKSAEPNFCQSYFFWSIQIGLIPVREIVDINAIDTHNGSVISSFVKMVQELKGLIVMPAVSKKDRLMGFIPSHFIVYNSDFKIDTLGCDQSNTVALWNYSNEYIIYPLSDEQKKSIEEKIALPKALKPIASLT